MRVAIEDLRAPAFPTRRGPKGYYAMSSDKEVIKENVRQIVGTPKGTRVMRARFGCDIHKRVFEPADDALRRLIDQDIREALGEWEPRIDVVSVAVGQTDDNHRIRYVVRYRILATGESDDFSDVLQLSR